ncbi:hypothetical protein DEIGR_103012 [Deinococcus grandis]|uniref:Uncharacterized protein n=1 Tax=Deinococcus grandis TaxID=57498 RepID=A0A100HNX6_9DEIO|nr:hypothetical protein DEGR_02390 [Deinococcus grandis]GAQ22985.1 hypothetical protein DEIGR_103012 [Deinococcus grandis]
MTGISESVNCSGRVLLSTECFCGELALECERLGRAEGLRWKGGAWRRATPPPSPLPQRGRGSSVALGKGFDWCGGVVMGGDVSGLDAILRPPQGPRATRTTAGGGLRSLARQLEAIR